MNASPNIGTPLIGLPRRSTRASPVSLNRSGSLKSSQSIGPRPGSFRPQRKKLWNILEHHAKDGTVSLAHVNLRRVSATARSGPYSQTDHCFDSSGLDPVQVKQMAEYLETVYVSGWQNSSIASSPDEPGPGSSMYVRNTTQV